MASEFMRNLSTIEKSLGYLRAGINSVLDPPQYAGIIDIISDRCSPIRKNLAKYTTHLIRFKFHSIHLFMRTVTLFLLSLIFLTSPTYGDTVWLKNGKKLEGKVTVLEGKKRVRIEVEEGSITEISLNEVEKIEPGLTRAEKLEKQIRELNKKDPENVQAWVQLGIKAHRLNLKKKARELFTRVLKLDPHQKDAREALGYIVHNNRWVLKDDLKKNRNLTEVDGQWVNADQKAKIELESLKKRMAQILEGVDTDNKKIQSFAIERLKNLKEPRMREALLSFLSDPVEAVRVVAVLELANREKKHKADLALSQKKKKQKLSPKEKQKQIALEKKMGAYLLQRVLLEKARVGRKGLLLALDKMEHEEFFRQALAAIATEASKDKRAMIAEGILFSLKKSWMKRLMDALKPAPPNVREQGNPEILSVLTRIARDQDFGYDIAKWKSWWVRHAHLFVDQQK